MVLRETINPPIKSSLSLLAIAGIASAVFTLTDFITGDLAQYSVGFIFGLALAIYFALREGERNPTKIVAFLGACTAAYAASMFSAFRLDGIFRASSSMGSSRLDIPMSVFFGAGCVGAFIVLAAGIFLFRSQDISWNSVGRVLLWSLGGGVLGVMGGGADGLRTRGTYNNFWLLFLVWQPGAAALLGLLLNRERKLLTAPSQAISEQAEHPPARVSRGILTVPWIFFTFVFAFIGFLAFRTIQSRRMASARAAASARFLADAPSTTDLQQLETLPVEQALIVSKIAGLYPWAPMSAQLAPVAPIQPRAIKYSIGYTGTLDPPISSARRIVAVDVEEMPNANWARYNVRYPGLVLAIDFPKAFSRVTKFGQTVVQNTMMRYPDGGGILEFLWASGRFVVTVRYETPDVNEEFLRQYLEKYPSSL
jgi:hypothetical protein